MQNIELLGINHPHRPPVALFADCVRFNIYFLISLKYKFDEFTASEGRRLEYLKLISNLCPLRVPHKSVLCSQMKMIKDRFSGMASGISGLKWKQRLLTSFTNPAVSFCTFLASHWGYSPADASPLIGGHLEVSYDLCPH